MAGGYAGAVRKGTMAAARLHRDLGLRSHVERRGGNIDVFGAIQSLNLPLLLRPLDGLLGAYFDKPFPGVLVTTERPMSIQRWTAAHELGHHTLHHNPSLDDENILRRMPLSESEDRGGNLQEDEADAFAIEFMMPRWLILWHSQRQGWSIDDFNHPHIVYQLSLRLGASYEATCWTLARNRYISITDARTLLDTKPRELKVELLGPYSPNDYRGDVWLLTERDAGTQIDGSRNDLFVLRLEEHSGGGYLWNINQLKDSGFAIVLDELETLDDEGVGAPVIRRVTAASSEPHRGKMVLDERRPWESEPLSIMDLDFDFTGPEKTGLSRAERRKLLEAA